MLRRSLGLLLLVAACKPDARPLPTKESSSDAGATPVVATAAADAAAPEETAREIPTLVPERFEPGGRHPQALFPIEGALMVLEGERHVGRIVGDGVEWLAKEISAQPTPIGQRVIERISGWWPDGVDAIYAHDGGRVAAPSYYPLTGKGVEKIYGGGGGGSDIAGVARVGESTLVMGSINFEGTSIVNVRGRPLPRRPSTAKQLGCSGDYWSGWGDPQKPEERPGIYPDAFAGTPAGTLVSVGMLCGKKHAAEVWDKAGKARVVDLDAMAAGSSASGARALRGRGDDELWLLVGGRVVHFQDGSFAPLPDLPGTQDILLSDNGPLHAYDGQTLHRLDEGAWVPVARLAWPTRFRRMGMDRAAFWADRDGAVVRLREGKSLGYREPCATPFVYLFDASPKNANDYTFPATQKALASFPEVSELGLVEVVENGTRRLGVTVRSKAQGEAVIAHVKATMKDESPGLYCYEPRSPRRIALEAAAKAPGAAP